MLDTQNDHFPDVLPDAAQNTIGAATRRPDSGEVVAERLSHPSWLFDQSRGDEVDHRRSHGFRKLSVES